MVYLALSSLSIHISKTSMLVNFSQKHMNGVLRLMGQNSLYKREMTSNCLIENIGQLKHMEGHHELS